MSPSEIRSCTLKLAEDLALVGMPDAAERLRAAATFPATSGSEWLGELGLAVREVQRKNSLPATIQDGLEKVMAAVHVAWPKM